MGIVLTVKILHDLPLCLALVQQLKGRWLIEEEKEDNAKANTDNIDVVAPTPAKRRVSDEFAS